MLLPFFQWCESLWLGQFVVNSNWLFPVIEAVHLLALSVLGGAVTSPGATTAGGVALPGWGSALAGGSAGLLDHGIPFSET